MWLREPLVGLGTMHYYIIDNRLAGYGYCYRVIVMCECARGCACCGARACMINTRVIDIDVCMSHRYRCLRES